MLGQFRELSLLAVDIAEQSGPVAQPADFEAGCQAEAVHAKIGPVRVAVDLPGIVLWAEKAGMLSRPGQRALHEERRQVDAAGNAVAARPEIGVARGIAGPIVARRHLVEKCPRLKMPGQHVVRGDQVVVVAMGQRTHQGIAVGPGGQSGQVFAQLHVRPLLWRWA